MTPGQADQPVIPVDNAFPEIGRGEDAALHHLSILQRDLANFGPALQARAFIKCPVVEQEALCKGGGIMGVGFDQLPRRVGIGWDRQSKPGGQRSGKTIHPAVCAVTAAESQAGRVAGSISSTRRSSMESPRSGKATRWRFSSAAFSGTATRRRLTLLR